MAWPVVPRKVRGFKPMRRAQGGFIGAAVRTVLFGSTVRPSFSLDLITTLVPERALGSSTPTFTRASTAYQTDFEGKLNLVPSGAARMQGARVVRNYVQDSEDLTTANWTAQAGVTVSNIAGSGPSGNNASRVQVDANGARVYQAALNTTAIIGHSYIPSVYIKSNTGASHVARLAIGDGGVPTYTSNNVTTSWQRLALPAFTATATTIYVYIGGNGSDPAIDVLATEVQLEDVTGQTNQNPSEYVSVGVLSAPYHGAGVDGVKYFSTLNGNTVTDNVVTEAQGAPITSAAAEAAGGVTAGVVDASGPLGYLPEGSRTNSVLQSQTIDSATWGGGPGTQSVVADQYVAPDGTTTMDKLLATAGSDNHFRSQTNVAMSATATTVSAYLRYVNQRWFCLQMYDGTSTFAASFDLLNGTAGAVTASTTSTITATELAGVYRITVTATTAATAAGVVYLIINNADQASSQVWSPAGTEAYGVWGVQIESGAFASTYIPTTTTAVTRAADVLTYPSAGNISGTQGSAYAEVTSGTVAGTTNIYIGNGTGANAPLAMAGASDTFVVYDGTNLISISGVTARPFTTPVKKLASSWGGATLSGSVNGAAALSGAFTGVMAMGSIGVGVWDTAASGVAPFGTIRNVRIFGKALSASRLQALTS